MIEFDAGWYSNLSTIELHARMPSWYESFECFYIRAEGQTTASRTSICFPVLVQRHKLELYKVPNSAASSSLLIRHAWIFRMWTDVCTYFRQFNYGYDTQLGLFIQQYCFDNYRRWEVTKLLLFSHEKKHICWWYYNSFSLISLKAMT